MWYCQEMEKDAKLNIRLVHLFEHVKKNNIKEIGVNYNIKRNDIKTFVLSTNYNFNVRKGVG